MVGPVKKRNAKSKDNVVDINQAKSDEEELLRLGHDLLEAEANKKKKAAKWNLTIKSSKADFKEKIEQGRSNDPTEIENKLEEVESSWQDWQHNLAGRTEETKTSNEAVKAAFDALREFVEERKQIKFDFGDNPAE